MEMVTAAKTAAEYASRTAGRVAAERAFAVMAAAARTATEDDLSSEKTPAEAAAKARNVTTEAAADQSAEEEQLRVEVVNAEYKATSNANQDSANERFRAMPAAWKGMEQNMRQNMRPVEGGRDRKEAMYAN